MKKYLLPLFLFIFSTVALKAAPFELDDERLFFQFSGGFSAAGETEMFSLNNTGTNTYDSGYNFSFAVGQYVMGSAFFSLEYSYMRMGIDRSTLISKDGTDTVISTSTTGNLSGHNLMLNLVYEFPIHDHFFAYLGAGGGVSWAKGNHGMEDSVIAIQAMAGIGMAISEDIALIVGYRMFQADDLEDTDANANQFTWDSPLVHKFEAGVRYAF